MPDPGPAHVGNHYVLEIDNKPVAHFLSCSGLQAEYETYPYSEGGLNEFVHQLKGRMRYGNLTLSRGVSNNKELLEWFQKPKERAQRGAVTIKMLDAKLAVVQEWAFSAAWAVRYNGPELGSEGRGMSIESLEIAHEGLVPGVN
jgi:phage tail-like protein